MFFRSVISQSVVQLKKRSTFCVFYILLALVLANYIGNVRNFAGTDLVHMYQPMKLLMLSYNKTYYNGSLYLLFIQLYPLIVAIPAGFSFARDEQVGENVYLASRMGYRKYIFSWMVSAFAVTFIIFTVPFMVEIVLNCLSFPLTASGDLSNFGFYTAEYTQSVHQYLLESVYLQSPFIYAIVMTLFFCVFSGCLAVITLACSMIFKVKYTVFLVLPAFLVINGLEYLNVGRSKLGLPSVNLMHYIMLFNDEIKFRWYLPASLFILLVISVILAIRKGRKDCL